jgi:hypothetical protein
LVLIFGGVAAGIDSAGGCFVYLDGSASCVAWFAGWDEIAQVI